MNALMGTEHNIGFFTATSEKRKNPLTLQAVDIRYNHGYFGKNIILAARGKTCFKPVLNLL